MSRIGKLPIIIPPNVDIQYNNSEMIVKGKFGTLQMIIPETINVQQDESKLKVSLKNESRNLRSLYGLYRTLINNMIVGVSEQFNLTLILQGVGYRAAVQGKEIILNLGYSHPVKMKILTNEFGHVIRPRESSVQVCDHSIEVLKFEESTKYLGRK